MTVIAVRKTDSEIIIAADSQRSCGGNKTLDAVKIRKHNNCIVACAGNALDISLLNMFLRTHIPKGSTEDDILDLLSEFIDWKIKKTKDADYVSSVILIIDERIFHIRQYGILSVDKEFVAIGCGMFCALSAMEMGAMPDEAVKVACKYDTGCGGGIQTVIVPIKGANVAMRPIPAPNNPNPDTTSI